MFGPDYKDRQLRPHWDEAQLKALGSEMAAKGQLGLRVVRNHISVSSLEFLEAFQHLHSVEIRDITKGIAVLAKLTELRSVALCELATKNVSFLKNLPLLEVLWINAVRLKEWNTFGDLKQVKAITLLGLRQPDFAFLAAMENLQVIQITWCSRLTKMPSLRNLKKLRRVELDTVNRLTDISGIADAPNIEEIIILSADKLAPEAFDCLREHPTIKSILLGIAPINSAKWRDIASRIPDQWLKNGLSVIDKYNFDLI